MSLLRTIPLTCLAACLGPSADQQAFVADLEAAAAQALLNEGATEATTRPIRADRVVWLKGAHTAVVDTTWPAGRLKGTASIPVEVRFARGDAGDWRVTSVHPDPADLATLRSRLDRADARSASIRKQQASYDARVQAAHDAFIQAAAEGALDGVFPDMKHIEINGCTIRATVPDAWGAAPKPRRERQLEAIGGVWTGIIDKKRVKCADPGFEARGLGGQVLGRWRRSSGVE